MPTWSRAACPARVRITPNSVTGLAVEMLDYVAGLGREDLAVGLRIGIHSGRVVAGVIGKHKFSYDIWGDTVNTAARLQTSASPAAFRSPPRPRAGSALAGVLEPRGAIELKGLGEVATYFVRGSAAARCAS